MGVEPRDGKLGLSLSVKEQFWLIYIASCMLFTFFALLYPARVSEIFIAVYVAMTVGATAVCFRDIFSNWSKVRQSNPLENFF